MKEYPGKTSQVVYLVKKPKRPITPSTLCYPLYPLLPPVPPATPSTSPRTQCPRTGREQIIVLNISSRERMTYDPVRRSWERSTLPHKDTADVELPQGGTIYNYGGASLPAIADLLPLLSLPPL